MFPPRKRWVTIWARSEPLSSVWPRYFTLWLYPTTTLFCPDAMAAMVSDVHVARRLHRASEEPRRHPEEPVRRVGDQEGVGGPRAGGRRGRGKALAHLGGHGGGAVHERHPRQLRGDGPGEERVVGAAEHHRVHPGLAHRR